jgi:hypothetical protein
MQSNVLWKCTKCNRIFIDEEALYFEPVITVYESTYPVEPQSYWLGINEPICEECAIESRIPSIDKE